MIAERMATLTSPEPRSGMSVISGTSRSLVRAPPGCTIAGDDRRVDAARAARPGAPLDVPRPLAAAIPWAPGDPTPGHPRHGRPLRRRRVARGGAAGPRAAP